MTFAVELQDLRRTEGIERPGWILAQWAGSLLGFERVWCPAPLPWPPIYRNPNARLVTPVPSHAVQARLVAARLASEMRGLGFKMVARRYDRAQRLWAANPDESYLVSFNEAHPDRKILVMGFINWPGLGGDSLDWTQCTLGRPVGPEPHKGHPTASDHQRGGRAGGGVPGGAGGPAVGWVEPTGGPPRTGAER